MMTLFCAITSCRGQRGYRKITPWPRKFIKMLNEGLAATQRTLNNLVVEKPLKPPFTISSNQTGRDSKKIRSFKSAKRSIFKRQAYPVVVGRCAMSLEGWGWGLSWGISAGFGNSALQIQQLRRGHVYAEGRASVITLWSMWLSLVLVNQDKTGQRHTPWICSYHWNAMEPSVKQWNGTLCLLVPIWFYGLLWFPPALRMFTGSLHTDKLQALTDSSPERRRWATDL